MALYKKPANVKYTDMCIYIDNNIYRDNLTEDEENTIFEYLYHIALMIARKANYFTRQENYEDFALFFATSIYCRLKNPKQWIFDEEANEPQLPKIRSVLNYMKNVAYPRKVEFEQKFYSQIMSKGYEEDEKEFVEYSTEYSFSDQLSQSIESLSMVEFNECLGDICLTTKRFLKHIPYKTNSLTWYNIYLSCLLTLLNTLILPKREIARLKELKHEVPLMTKIYDNVCRENLDNLVVLYHLDKSMRDYIWVLVQEIKHVIAKDLSVKNHTYIPATSSINALALAEINMDEYNYGD